MNEKEIKKLVQEHSLGTQRLMDYEEELWEEYYPTVDHITKVWNHVDGEDFMCIFRIYWTVGGKQESKVVFAYTAHAGIICNFSIIQEVGEKWKRIFEQALEDKGYDIVDVDNGKDFYQTIRRRGKKRVEE